MEHQRPVLDEVVRLVLQEAVICDGERLRPLASVCVYDADTQFCLFRRIEEELLCLIAVVLDSSKRDFAVPTSAFAQRHLGSTDVPATSASRAAVDDIDAFISSFVPYCQLMKACLSATTHLENVPMKLVSSLLVLLGIGHDLRSWAYDALFAFLPLLHGSSSSLAGGTRACLSEQIWDRLCHLLDSGLDQPGATYRLWFQWTHLPCGQGPSQVHLHSDRYWVMLQSGLLSGFAEQRKFCLGILQQSLALARADIHGDHMVFLYDRRPEFVEAYKGLITVFETVVLDRYPNQVEASLVWLEESIQADSPVHVSWMKTLLAAALSPRVQDGVRKIVGTWYLGFILDGGCLHHHGPLFVDAFLPWAIQGSLFTSTMDSASAWGSTHGDALCKAMQIFMVGSDSSEQRALLVDVIKILIDQTRGIFPHAIPCLLEGLVDGCKGRHAPRLEAEDLDMVAQVPRRAGLPEFARDLCTIYCVELFNYRNQGSQREVPGWKQLHSRFAEIRSLGRKGLASDAMHFPRRSSPSELLADGSALSQLVSAFKGSDSRRCQGSSLLEATLHLQSIMDHDAQELDPCLLRTIFLSIWDEADVQDYPRAVLSSLPPLLLHPKCVKIAIAQAVTSENSGSLSAVIRLLLYRLCSLSETRIPLLYSIAFSLRHICLRDASILDVLPVEDVITNMVSRTSLPRPEFLLELVCAKKMQLSASPGMDLAFLSKREWDVCACVVDLLNRWPSSKSHVATRVLNRLLEPWRSQGATIPIVSKWKEAFQLQVMLVLVEHAVPPDKMDWYLGVFLDILSKEPWPRYRYLLDWIVARILAQCPDRIVHLLNEFTDNRTATPSHMAALIRLAVSLAPLLTDDAGDCFASRLMVHLVPLCTSPRIQIRFAAQQAFPALFSLAEERKYTAILDNEALRALSNHIRSLDKANGAKASGWTPLVDVTNHTLGKIFQGDYMYTDPPEREYVRCRDFQHLCDTDEPPDCAPRIPLGTPSPRASGPSPPPCSKSSSKVASKAPLQTKATNSMAVLPTSTPETRPTTLVVVASLIDNATNLGGLSRLSEIFGVEALHVRSLDVLSSRDFVSLAVTSHKHLPIRELPVPSVPSFLAQKKREGYAVVCVEQTDRSGILGLRGGELPRNCVLVLGSEREGVSSEVLACADRCVEIRQVGVTRSLNVQTAAGIAVWEWWRGWGEHG